MAILCTNFAPFRTLPLMNFRNVMKLKLIHRQMSVFTCGPDFMCTSDKKRKDYHTSYMSVKYLKYNGYLDGLGFRNMSKYTRCSQNNGFIFNQIAKKRFKSKSAQFTDKVKDKIQNARKETRKKVEKIQEMKENILTVPNGLCLFRMVATPVIGYFVLTEFYTASLSLFVLAGFTDCIDGYIARNFPNQQTMIGSFLDPAADKLLISTLFVTLTVNGLIPVPLTSLIIFRDVCLMGAGFYIRYVSLPPPKTISRYFDMSFVTARLSPTTISKVNTVIQLSLVAASLASPVFNFIDHLYLQILWYITGTTTVLSAASYAYLNHSTYKLFSAPEEKEDKK